MKLKQLANNQTELQLEKVNVLISYETPVAAYHKATNEYYHTSKKWSATTTRHIKGWCPCFERSTPKPQEFFDNLLKIGEIEQAAG